MHAMDIDGARRRSHEPTAVRPELGLGWQESTHGWTGTSCRAAPGRAGRRSKMIVGSWSQSVPTDNSNGTIPQRFVTLLLKD
jgi:hypothetical protein